MSDIKQRLYIIADEMRGMASLKSHFIDNPYDMERAERMMALAAELVALIDTHDSLEQIKAEFMPQPWLRLSPVLGVDAFLLNAQDELLLIKRKDNGRWALPGGLNEIGRTPAETAVVELWEEAGVKGRAERLLSLLDNRKWGGRARFHLVNMTFHVVADDPQPVIGTECLDAAFFSREALAGLELHYGHERRIPASWDALINGETLTDLADSASLDLPMHQRD